MTDKIVDKNAGDTYKDTIFLTWLKNTNQRRVFEKVLSERSDWWCKDGMTILELGCGDGASAARLFDVLDKKGLQYSYTGVDPSSEQLERFKTRFPGKNDLQLTCAGAEDYAASKKFDLTVVVHALYYVNDLAAILNRICAASEKAIVVHHGKLGINEVHERFRDYVRVGDNIVSTWEDVRRALDRIGASYELQIAYSEADVSSCNDPQNPEGRNLIKFFLDRADLSDDRIVEVSDWFRTRPDTLLQDDGYFFINGIGGL
jgi:SAM-dependent methyltransferase